MSREMHTRRSADAIREQLGELRTISGLLEDSRDVDVASELLYQSLKHEEAHLVGELESASWAVTDTVLQLRFPDGGAVANHSVGAGFLGDVLSHLQGLVFGVAQVQAGEATDRAPVRESLASEFGLRVRTLAPGSFVVVLDLPAVHEQESLFLGSKRQQVIDDVRSLFTEEMVEHGDQREHYLRLMHRGRVKTHYESLLQALKNSGTTVELTSPGSDWAAVFTAAQAEQRIEWMALLEETAEYVTLTGQFTMGDVDSGGRYKLVVDDTKYHGPVSEKALGQMQSRERNLLGTEVTVRLRIVTRQQVDDLVSPTVEYFLEEFLGDSLRDQGE